MPPLQQCPRINFKKPKTITWIWNLFWIAKSANANCIKSVFSILSRFGLKGKLSIVDVLRVIFKFYLVNRFICDGCLKRDNRKRKENKYNAKKLPVTKLGSFIEGRVNNFLRKKDCGAGEVSIRVVSTSQKNVEIKPGMKQR